MKGRNVWRLFKEVARAGLGPPHDSHSHSTRIVQRLRVPVCHVNKGQDRG